MMLNQYFGTHLVDYVEHIVFKQGLQLTLCKMQSLSFYLSLLLSLKLEGSLNILNIIESLSSNML